MRKLVFCLVLAMTLVGTLAPEASGSSWYRRRYYRPLPYYRSYVYQHRYFRPRYYYRPYRWFGGAYYYPQYRSYYPAYYPAYSYPAYYQPAPYCVAPDWGWSGRVAFWW